MSIHTHMETYLSASTVSTFVKKAKSLGRSYLAYTDYSLMTSAFKFYKEAKSNGIKPVVGVELMFFDNDDIACQKAGGKYYPISVYVKDFEAYKALISLSSRRKEFYTTKLDDKLPLYNWKDLESLRGKNVEIAIGGHMSLPYRLKVKGSSTLIVPFKIGRAHV